MWEPRMNCVVEVRLDKGIEKGEWRSCLLDVPGVEVLKAWNEDGASVAFEQQGILLRAEPDITLARAQLRLTADLVAASALDDAKLNFDREKLASDDRSSRRTVWFTVIAALISATATIAVALIARPGQTPVQAPPGYRQLSECQRSLDRLATLSSLPTQTLGDLQAAVKNHEDACRDSLRAAVESAPN
jgi:hypothetical protein